MTQGIGIPYGAPLDSSGNSKTSIAKIDGTIVTSNSTSTPLAGDAAFTGEWYNGLNAAIIYLTVTADEPSATDGVCIQFSTDGTNVDGSDVYTYLDEGFSKTYSFQSPTNYFRVCYTNGATPQSVFRLQTIVKSVYGKPSSHRIQDSIVDDDDAELVKSVLSGKNPADTFVNFGATTAGNFKVSLEELENTVSSNSNTQLNTTPFHADGTEGNLISGVNYASGKSGVDSSTETITTTTYEHKEIHDGNHYDYCDYALAQGLAAVIEFVFTTPNTTEQMHFTFLFSASTGATMELYEGSSSIVGGTSITPVNNNRNSPNTSNMTIVKDPTSLTDGTRLNGYLAGGARVSGIMKRDNEKPLKTNTSYLLRITSLAAANDIAWCAEWYEHTPKN